MNLFLEIFGTVTGLVYVFLEIKHHKAMWMVGILMSLCYLAVFLFSHLYASMALYGYYLVMSIYGWITWNHQEKEGAPIRTIRWGEALTALLLLLAVFALSYFGLAATDDPYPAADAAVTTLNVVATWLLTRSIVEQWALLVLANLISIVLYLRTGLYFTTGLSVVYLISSIIGWVKWGKLRSNSYLC